MGFLGLVARARCCYNRNSAVANIGDSSSVYSDRRRRHSFFFWKCRKLVLYIYYPLLQFLEQNLNVDDILVLSLLLPLLSLLYSFLRGFEVKMTYIYTYIYIILEGTPFFTALLLMYFGTVKRPIGCCHLTT